MWITSALLGLAIVVEVGASALLPRTQGFHHLGWSVAVLVGYGASIWLLSVVVRGMSVSAAYAIWAGAGTAMVAVIGALFLGERLDLVKVLALAAIIAGVIVLNLTGGAHSHSA